MPDFKIIKSVDDHDSVKKILDTTTPDLIIYDLANETPEVLAWINKLTTKSKLLLFTNTHHPQTLRTLVDLGVRGIISKYCSENDITNALKTVSKGDRFYCNISLNRMAELRDSVNEGTDVLSKRELEILKLIAKGNKSQQISKKLHISVHTVNAHRKNILRKLNISSPIHLVAYAIESGLVKIDHDK